MINKIAEYYQPVACRGSLLFLLMNDLPKLKSYYQFPFITFLDLYTLGVTVTANAYRERSTMGELSLPTSKSAASSLKNSSYHSPTSIIKKSPKIDTMNKNTSDKKDKSDCADSIAVNVKDLYQINADIISTENRDSQLEKIGVEISKRAEEIKKFPDDKKFNIRSRIIFLKKNVTAVLYDFLRIGISERDEEIVGTLLSLRILQIEGHINQV